MPTVQQVARKLIEQKPFMQEALSRGLINNAALATYLSPSIEQELGQQVKFSAVNMAIRRLGEKLKATNSKVFTFHSDATITLKSDLVEIILYKSDTQKITKKCYGLVDFRQGDFLTLTEGLHEVMIITNGKYEQRMMGFFPQGTVKKVLRDLVSLTVNIPPSAVNEVGMFYMLTRSLAWENIPIVDIVSTFTEMTFILKEEQGSRGFDVLKSLIRNA